VKVPLISIKIENRQTPHEPGETLEGEYQIDAVEPANVRAVELSVLWFTEGKSDEDVGVHHFERRTGGGKDETADLTELRKFAVRLPSCPLSYEGVLFKLRWRVRVRVFLDSGRDYFAELPFQLGNVPDAKPLPSVDGEPQPDTELASPTVETAMEER
jgi:hypothetical protein